MNYDSFRHIWHQALDEAGLLPFGPRPTETIDLDRMNRTHSIIVALRGVQRAGSFYISASLSWEWDALQSARTATTEEDLLIELFGEAGYHQSTQRPWLRIDVTLQATLPLDSPLPMPEASAWRRWTAEVMARLSPLLPIKAGNGTSEPVALSWRNEPSAKLRCDPDGRLYLTGVELSAWQGIDLPRQWDDPDREWDGDPETQVADLAGRLRAALQSWEECLRYLEQLPD